MLADNWLGHYNTMVISFVTYGLGIMVLTVSSVPILVAKGWGLPGLIIAMTLVGLGGAGVGALVFLGNCRCARVVDSNQVKSIMPPFIADQYTTTRAQLRVLPSGEKVITDRTLTLQYIYNLYFWAGNIGSLSWFATVFLEEHVGFTAVYGLTLGLVAIALLMLLFGRHWYILAPRAQETVFPEVLSILCCAAKNGCRLNHTMPEYQRSHGQCVVPWTENTVVGLKRGLLTCRVLLAFIMFYVCFDQMQNNLISQASQMNTNSTPNDLLPAMNQVGCIIIGPLVQLGLYPLLHRHRIYLKPIARITTGFAFITTAMLYATVVQHTIYNSTPCYNFPDNCKLAENASLMNSRRPNVWLQAPVYFFIATGEIFAYTTALEYAYDHSPKNMKAVVQAVSLAMGGIGSAVALALTAVAHDPNLVIFYASLSGAMAATTVLFWVLFHKYDRRFPFENISD